jgi:hypothetical protein
MRRGQISAGGLGGLICWGESLRSHCVAASRCLMRHPERENSNRTGPGIKRCKTCGQNGPEEMYLRWWQILTIFVGKCFHIREHICCTWKESGSP